MKRIAVFLCLLITLTGCSSTQTHLDRAMALRAKLLTSSVRFDAQITADYGSELYTFSMTCEADTSGDVRFSVTAPEAIAGISGTLSAAGGKLTFDDTALAFGLMADGLLSPVAAPWTVLRSLRSGYLNTCCQEAGSLRISVNDSYADNALYLDIWLDSQDFPKRAEIFWQGRRILSVNVTNFAFL